MYSTGVWQHCTWLRLALGSTVGRWLHITVTSLVCSAHQPPLALPPFPNVNVKKVCLPLALFDCGRLCRVSLRVSAKLISTVLSELICGITYILLVRELWVVTKSVGSWLWSGQGRCRIPRKRRRSLRPAVLSRWTARQPTCKYPLLATFLCWDQKFESNRYTHSRQVC